MEISKHTDAILSDDYEEGEILDDDTLYDNVSSLEEFSGSDTELKSHGEIPSIVVKKTSSDGRKEKHHKRKEHKCKENSICRKERSGKHCYARIRKGKATVPVIEKTKAVEIAANINHDQNQKKKSHVIYPAVHGHMKNDFRRLPMQKDLLEEENRCHKHLRYYDSHKLQAHRVEKKKICEKLIKKHLAIESRSRPHVTRKRTKSQSPKLHTRNQLKEVAPRGGSSLLKRLVGSGSIGVKTPKEVEEPKKPEVTSVIDLPKDVIVVESSVESNDESENQEIKVVCVNDVEPEASKNLEGKDPKDDNNKQKAGENDVTDISSGEDSMSKEKDIVSTEACVSITLEQDVSERTLKVSDGGSITAEINISKEDKQSETVQINKDSCEPSELESTQIPIIESENDSLSKTRKSDKNNEPDIFVNSGAEKHEQEIAEDIDELTLRLEALRTAMLRKHKERKKRGFVCKKKSTIEDDSFAEYVLSNVEKDNSSPTKVEDEDCNGLSMLGDLLNPEDMVIDKNDKGDDENECNILENFSYPTTYPVQNSSNVPLHYLGFGDVYSMFTYPELNGSVPYNHLDNDKRNVSQEFPGYVYPDSHLFGPPILPDAPQMPLPKEIETSSSIDFNVDGGNNQFNDNLLEHCLKEINPNKNVFTEKTKRVRKMSAKLKAWRRKELVGKNWHSGRMVMKRKLIRREYAQQKRRRRESLRDLRIIRIEGGEETGEVQEESDEESALRELALKSVKEKPKNLLDTEALEKAVDEVDISINSVKLDEGKIFHQLQIEIDNNINEKPLISCDSGSTPTNLSSNEAWDDIDEDILRAQLLSSLSSRMPEKNEETPKTFVQRFCKKQVKALRKADRKSFEFRLDKRLKNSPKVNKENFKKITRIKPADLAKRKMGILRTVNHLKQKPETSGQPSVKTIAEVPIVPKFIISLNEDSSSEDEIQSQVESDKIDVVKSIDLFLQEARIENDLKKGMVCQDVETTPSKTNETKTDDVKPTAVMKLKVTNHKLLDNGNGTPQVLKHLPAWQQEEYRRLKKQIAEKEKLLKAAKDKVQLPNESEIINESSLSKSANIKNNLNEEEKEVCNKDVEEITASGCSISDLEHISNKDNNNEANNINNNNTIEQTTNELKTKETDQQQTNVKALPTSPVKNIDRSRIVEEVNHMAKIVAHLEREMGSYRNLQKDIVIKRKQLLVAKLNMTRKKKSLFEIKKLLLSKEKSLQAKIDENSLPPDVPKDDPKKQARRDLELCKLRMREFSLRTKMIFDEIEQTGFNRIVKHNSKELTSMTVKSPLENNQDRNNCIAGDNNIRTSNLESMEKAKIDNKEIKSLPKGASSETENQSKSWDPFVPICPFDLSGVCKDEECKFQHLKAS